MFTIEHEFDATVITLVDEGNAVPASGTELQSPPYLQEDVAIMAFEECIAIEQLDTTTDRVQRVTLSQAQLADLFAALDLPEGVYKLIREKPATGT